MAVSNPIYIDKGTLLATCTDTAGGGARMSINLGRFANRVSVQRTSGTGTYTVEGSNDGTNWGALSTAIAAKNDANMITIADAPKFIGISVAAAAAVVVVHALSATM